MLNPHRLLSILFNALTLIDHICTHNLLWYGQILFCESNIVILLHRCSDNKAIQNHKCYNWVYQCRKCRSNINFQYTCQYTQYSVMSPIVQLLDYQTTNIYSDHMYPGYATPVTIINILWKASTYFDKVYNTLYFIHRYIHFL